MKNEIETLRRWIGESQYTVAFTGAGVSTDSGLNDFRSASKGVYHQPNPYGVSTDRILSPRFYEEHPLEFFEFYRTKLLDLSAKPNYIHYAMADMERQGKLQAIITQNADNLHQRAGSVKVIDFHGNVYDNTCPLCGKRYPPTVVADCAGIPYCDCGGIIRPGIVLFDEIPDMHKVMEAIRQLNRAELLLIAGSSLKVSSAYRMLKRFKGRIAILNLDPTPFDQRADLVIHDLLTPVFHRLWPMDQRPADLPEQRKL